MNRILITGAAGGLGSMAREKLRGYVPHLRLSDREDIGPLHDGEEFIACDLGDRPAVMSLVRDCDAIIHFGGKSIEGTWDDILNSNIVGCYNIYEAARQNGKPRIVYASSNHAIGFHHRETFLDDKAPHRPDSLYGVSKCFGEDLGRYYWDKFGLESIAIRIGSCFPEPRDRRMLATWLSADDLISLIKAVLTAGRVAHNIVYGVSDNREVWWDNRHAGYLGWSPKDSSEPYRVRIEAASPQPDPTDPAVVLQGGNFAKAGHFEDPKD